MIGKKIRELRHARDWSLAELSEKSGVALSTISRIETGRMTGTLESHVAIARAFGIRLSELYAAVDPIPTAELCPAQPEKPEYTQRGASLSILTPSSSQKKMLPALCTILPKANMRMEKGPAGSERFLYLLKGTLEVAVGSETFRLKSGEGLYLQAAFPQTYTNVGTSPAVALLITTPPNL